MVDNKTPKLEVNVENGTLAFADEPLDLWNLKTNFVGAGINKISNSPKEIALELNYRKEKDLPEDYFILEGENIYKFLENKIPEVQVCSSDPVDFDTEVFPAIQIVGKFDAMVYNR